MSTMPDVKDTEMPPRKRFINKPPQTATDPTTITDLKKEFARRLQARLVDMGWSQSDLARAAAKHMRTKKFNRDNISLYIRGEHLPTPTRLSALLKALDMTREQLLPDGAVRSVDDETPPLMMRDIGKGIVWLQVNRALPQDIAFKIMSLLQKVDKIEEE